MEFFRTYFELLNLIPMPFQVAVFIFSTSIIIYWITKFSIYLLAVIGKIGIKIVEWGTKLLLLPAYLLISLFRLIKVNYAPFGVGIYDDIIESICRWPFLLFESITKIKSDGFRFPIGWVFLSMIIVVAAWYLAISPDVEGGLTQKYIFSAFNQYYILQQWAFSFSG